MLMPDTIEVRMRTAGDQGDPWALAIHYRAALERIADDDPDHQYQTADALRGVARDALGMTSKEAQ